MSSRIILPTFFSFANKVKAHTQHTLRTRVRFSVCMQLYVTGIFGLDEGNIEFVVHSELKPKVELYSSLLWILKTIFSGSEYRSSTHLPFNPSVCEGQPIRKKLA